MNAILIRPILSALCLCLCPGIASGEGKPPEKPDWKPTAVCQKSAKEATQVRHGHAADGKMWKGHACACRGWECLECGKVVDKVVDKAGPCCRRATP